MLHSRREFIKRIAHAIGAAAFMEGFHRLGWASAFLPQESNDYRALVSIFLYGGNDGNNTIIPAETAEYQTYASARGTLAIPQADLLPITPSNMSLRFGLHPSLRDIHDLWGERKLAVLCNVGTLVEPITRDQYLRGAQRPDSLFSHSDQQAQWQASISDQPSRTGWAGRLADRLGANEQFPILISVAGSSLFATGAQARPLALVPGSSFGLRGFGTSPSERARLEALRQLLRVDTEMELVRKASELTEQAIVNSQLLNQALSNAAPLQTQFPSTSLGKQLQQVAKIIAARGALGARRQIFFCSLGGFDTHNNQLPTQASLLAQLGQAMRAFYAATVELGVATSVTTFTLSDFGRTLKPAAGGGTDHAWGSHHFIMGGAVRGGDFYGRYPTLTIGGPDDASNEGRWIPNVAVDQYGATLALWFGLPPSELTSVFPNIGRFATPNLGFL